MRTFALNYLKEPALKDKNGFITEKCIEILGTDDEQRKDFANGYLEKAIKQDFEAVNSLIIQCFKEADEELRKDFANGYLEKAIKQDFEGVSKAITAECFKEADEELRKDFALNGYLEKAIKRRGFQKRCKKVV